MALSLLLSVLAVAGPHEFERLDAALPPAPAVQDVWFDEDEPQGFFEFGLGYWPVGRSIFQGYVGVLFLESGDVSGGTTPPLDVSDDVDMLPSIGGGMQYKLGGDLISWGVETGVDFAGRGGGVAFYSGTGGALIAVDVDLASVAWGVGPFVSAPLGESLRIYGAAGGLMQWSWFDQRGQSTTDTASGSGFGAGYYARAGIEYLLPNRTLLGLGGRWSDTRVDLSDGLGNLDLRGAQVLLTVSRSF